MSPHTPDTTPAALIARAKAEMAAGGYEAATTCAPVAIAEALVAQMPEPIDAERPACDMCGQPSDGRANHLPPLCAPHRAEFEAWVDARRSR